MAMWSSDLWKSENQTPSFFSKWLNFSNWQKGNCFTHRFDFIIFWLGMFCLRIWHLKSSVSRKLTGLSSVQTWDQSDTTYKTIMFSYVPNLVFYIPNLAIEVTENNPAWLCPVVRRGDQWISSCLLMILLSKFLFWSTKKCCLCKLLHRLVVTQDKSIYSLYVNVY